MSRIGLGFSGNHHQPPLVLPQRATHPSLPKGKELVTLPMNFSPLSFSPVGEMQVTPVLSKTERCRLLQFCQRLGDAGYSNSVKDWEMQVTPVLSKTGRCRLLRI